MTVLNLQQLDTGYHQRVRHASSRACVMSGVGAAAMQHSLTCALLGQVTRVAMKQSAAPQLHPAALMQMSQAVPLHVTHGLMNVSTQQTQSFLWDSCTPTCDTITSSVSLHVTPSLTATANRVLGPRVTVWSSGSESTTAAPARSCSCCLVLRGSMAWEAGGEGCQEMQFRAGRTVAKCMM